jgi:type IX secretion system substrate protein
MNLLFLSNLECIEHTFYQGHQCFFRKKSIHLISKHCAMKNASTTVKASSCFPFSNLILHTILVMLISISALHGQMVSVINSGADDEFAHPKDFLLTKEDESIDGICEDSLHRCTLRAALEEAAYLGVPAYVTFNVPPPGYITIDDTQGSFGPPDGSRLYGDMQNVEIKGSGAGTINLLAINNDTHVKGIRFANALIGILIAGNGNRLGLDNLDDANYIGGCTQNGIIIAGDHNNITGNVIGLDVLDNPNPNQFGIFITGKENFIGGTGDGHRNIISGNDIGIGVYTIGGDTTAAGNYIIGNQIGTDVSGENARGNRVGIDIIGPNVLVAGNTISGNTQSGVLAGIDAEKIIIAQNYIGLDVVGEDFIPNRVGVVLGPGSFDCDVDSNYIMGNLESGISVAGNDTPELLSSLHNIRGNTIASNAGPGILVSGNVANTTIGSSLTTDFAPNEIYDNSFGVAFGGFLSLGISRTTSIRKNDIHDNATKGIRIYDTCPTCQEQTFPPIITTYEEVDPVTAVITGTHHQAGAKIDIYTGDINLAGSYEGRVWLGSATVNSNFDWILTVDNCQCDIVATATSPLGSTSEFTDGEPIVTSIQDPPMNAINVFPNPSRDEVTFRFETLQPIKGSLSIFSVTGQHVTTLFEGHLQAGDHSYTWNPEGKSPGMYYYRFVDGSTAMANGKIVIVK